MTMRFQSIKGTRDLLPEESYQWQYVEARIRDTLGRYRFQEIRTPMFEETELFARGIGEATDIVTKEMYTFVDRGQKSLTLKPEMTAPVIRAYIENNLGEKAPLTKLYYFSPAFRQENPQAGRFRQFHQFGAELIGSPNPEADVETILLAMDIYEELGLRGVELRLNSVGDATCRPVYREKLRAFLKPRLDHLCRDCQVRYERNPLRILDCKNQRCRHLTEDVPGMVDSLCEECAKHFRAVQAQLTDLGVSYRLDKRLVRGLDYYTRTAYEIISRELGSQDALAGGGRYDLLTEALGGKPTPAVGFAAGLERLLTVMNKQGLWVGEPPRLDLFVTALGDAPRQEALRLCRQLRRAGFVCEMDFLRRSLKAQMREANRQKAKWVLVLGEEEMARRVVQVKEMQTGKQQEVAWGELPNHLRRGLGRDDTKVDQVLPPPASKEIPGS